MLCFIAASSMAATHTLDGEAAVHTAREFARAIHLADHLELKSVNAVPAHPYGFGAGQIFQVRFQNAEKRDVYVYVNEGGHVQWVQQNVPYEPAPRVSWRGNEKPPTDPLRDRVANQLIKAAHVSGPFALRPQNPGEIGPWHNAMFDLLVNGHRFFNLNPTYAYSISFNSKTLQSTSFMAPPPLPPVNAKSASISGAQANSLLTHWGRTHYRTGGGAAVVWGPTWHTDPQLKMELGYYKFSKEPTARLVWQGHVWTSFYRGPRTESGILHMYVDAVTGKLVNPDDPGMN